MTKGFGKAYLKLQKERKGTIIQRKERIKELKKKLKLKTKKRTKLNKLSKKQNEKSKRTYN